MFNGVVIIGNEDPFQFNPSTPGGSVLERAIKRSPGLNRDDFKILNLNQLGELDKIPMKGLGYKQRVILAFGPYAFRRITGLEGEYLNLEAIRGYPIDTLYGLTVGTYHPFLIVQGKQKLMGVLMLDLRKAVQYAKEGFAKKPLYYQENPTYNERDAFKRWCVENPSWPLAFDIETPNVPEEGGLPNQIFSIQFSLKPQTGIFFNWYGNEEETAREILALPNPKIGYNSWRFDGPMLEKMGVKLNGRHDDVIWAFHHYQPDLTTENKEGEDASISSRMGLQYVASFFDHDFHWKFMKKYKEMQKHYGIVDVDSLQRIWFTLPDQMKRMGVWEGYDKLRYALEPVLINMSARGIPVDDTKRVNLRQIIQSDKEVNFDLMQSLVPMELRNITPKGGYKKGWKGVKEKDGKIRFIDGPGNCPDRTSESDSEIYDSCDGE